VEAKFLKIAPIFSPLQQLSLLANVQQLFANAALIFAKFEKFLIKKPQLV